MQITVKLFATLRDRAGTSKVQVELAEPATVADLLTQMVISFPALEQSLPTVLVAVNQEYSLPTEPVCAGDEVALFPPVSGGSGEIEFPEYFAVTPDRLNFDDILATITRPETGAVCVFSGAVRGKTSRPDHVLATDHLEYEAYIPMAEKTLRQVAREIRQKYPKVLGIAIVQRIGALQVGETTIFVACAAGHRDDGCFEGARYGIDRVKEIVPIWKKEVGEDKEYWVEGGYLPTPGRDTEPSVTNGKRDNQPGRRAFVVGCPACGKTYDLDRMPVSCDCGTPLEVIQSPGFDQARIDQSLTSMWRYRQLLLPEGIEPVTMGEGWTPLVTVDAFGRMVYLKLENLNPSGAFKDRGASTLVSLLAAQAKTAIHDDSSGNAGAALAAYAARAGLAAKLYIPENASPVKLGQISLYGAELVQVPGPRSAARKAAREMPPENSFYASHIDHPFAVFAYKSIAFELWEQLGKRAPDAIVLPLGHGSQLLGLALGFNDLQIAGLIAHLPRLFGVQASGCAPFWQELNGGDDRGDAADLAEGIRIADPVRKNAVLEVIHASKGDVLAVSKDDILDGIWEFARRGFAVEPTSAVVWPVLKEISKRLAQDAVITVSVTGSGLKYPDLDVLIQGRTAHFKA